MAIETEHENIDELKKWGLGLEKVMENCGFCKTPTRYWHVKSNTPVCQSCSIFKDVSDIEGLS